MNDMHEHTFVDGKCECGATEGGNASEEAPTAEAPVAEAPASDETPAV